MKNILYVLMCLLFINGYACTSFGVVTKSGTIIGKNRDYYYDKQVFDLVYPNKQFTEWFGNSFKHNNKFYAVLSNNDVKMGVNQYGLTAIEEDPLYPGLNRRYIQPMNGYSEGMVLYGILQNFATVDEIIPYIKNIFSSAAPNFYQIADKKKILVVEVGFAESDLNTTRPYVYDIINSEDGIFVHTNTYTSTKFLPLNKLKGNSDIEKGSNYRLNNMTQLLKHTKYNEVSLFDLFMNTKSSLSKVGDKNWCQNTSIFRSYIHETNHIKVGDFENDKLFGTVSNLLITNFKDNTRVNLRVLDSLDTLENGDQKIVYEELNVALNTLFTKKSMKFTRKFFVRKAPQNNICI